MNLFPIIPGRCDPSVNPFCAYAWGIVFVFVILMILLIAILLIASSIYKNLPKEKRKKLKPFLGFLDDFFVKSKS